MKNDKIQRIKALPANGDHKDAVSHFSEKTMRKTQQKQILNVLKTIDEAKVNGFYADCQEGAIAIGEYIESIKGEGTQTVALLEEYLDLLVEACNGKISVKTLKRHIIKVGTRIYVLIKNH